MRRIIFISGLVIVAAVGGLVAGLILASGSGNKFAGSGGTLSTTGPHAVPAGNAMAVKTSPKRKILYYWDPMVGPSSISPKPGISSMGMALIPVYAPSSGAGTPGEVTVDPAMVQDMGIQTAPVTLGTLVHPVRVVGYLRTPAPGRYSITIRASGWIGKLFATTNGTTVKKGARLFTLYSPAILAAEEELIAAQKALAAARKIADRSAIRDTRELVQSVELRLYYLAVGWPQIKKIARTLKPVEYVTFYSPTDGVLTDIKVHQKSQITAGTTAMRVDTLSTLWLDAYVYENQLPWIHMGQHVAARIAAFPGHTFDGKIIFIDAFENPRNHTTAVRIELPNARNELRPGMYALADIHTTPFKHAILIPRRAVINSGTGEVTFVEISHGHFDPVPVRTGLSGGIGMRHVLQVLSGVGPGQKVVTSGQFMIDVESQLNEIKSRFMPKVPTTAAATSPNKSTPTTPDAGEGPPGGSTDGAAKPAAMPKGMKMPVTKPNSALSQ
jgi:RND family efflux transporter MFP subunit